MKFYNREINKIEKMIDKFYLVYSVGPQETKLCNYGSGGTSEWQLRVNDSINIWYNSNLQLIKELYFTKNTQNTKYSEYHE